MTLVTPFADMVSNTTSHHHWRTPLSAAEVPGDPPTALQAKRNGSWWLSRKAELVTGNQSDRSAFLFPSAPRRPHPDRVVSSASPAAAPATPRNNATDSQPFRSWIFATAPGRRWYA